LERENLHCRSSEFVSRANICPLPYSLFIPLLYFTLTNDAIIKRSLQSRLIKRAKFMSRRNSVIVSTSIIAFFLFRKIMVINYGKYDHYLVSIQISASFSFFAGFVICEF